MIKYFKAYRLLFICSLMISPIVCLAQTEKQIKELETVVVTATRTPKLLKNVPVITQVISAKDIKQTDATNIQELMTSILPGVEFSYAMNQQTVLNYQGFGGNKILFLIDGNRVAGETMNNPDYGRLNLDNVERIEIVKGAASTLYGSQAMGAVINIITKKAGKGLRANVNGRWGAFNNQRYGSLLSYRKDKFSMTTAMQYNSIDKQKMKNIGDFSQVDAHSSKSIKQSLGYNFSENLKLKTNASFFKRTRELSNDVHRHFYAYNANLGLKMKLGEAHFLDVNLGMDKYDKTQEFVPKREERLRYINRQETLRLLYTHNINPEMTLTLGADGMRDYLYSYQFEDVGDHQQYTGDAFAQFDYDVLPKLNLVTALRYDYFSATKANRLTPKLSLMYKILPYLRLRSSYSMGFRSPTLKETYMVFNMASMFMIYGNKDLKSESSHNFQASLEYARRNYNATLIVNHSQINNRITTVWNTSKDGLKGKKGAMEYQNIEKMRISGVEASVSARLDFGLSARLCYAYTYEHDMTSDVGVKLSMTRPHSANVQLKYSKGWQKYGFALALNGRYLSSVETAQLVPDANGGNSLEKTIYEGYQMWDLNLSQRFFKGVHLSLRVNNLLNYIPEIYNNNSPATTGRTFSCGLSLDLHKLY